MSDAFPSLIAGLVLLAAIVAALVPDQMVMP